MVSASCGRLTGIIPSFLSTSLLIGEQSELLGGTHDRQQ
jgi:hypothetical protein